MPIAECLSTLTDQEVRCASKTSIRMNEERQKGVAAAEAYMLNLTQIQIDVMKKVIHLAEAAGEALPREIEAFKKYGVY